MARKDDFVHTQTHCVMCGDPIPEDRPKMALTCSDACKIARKNYRRSRQDQRECRYCQKPSTPEQRALFQQWRRRPQDAEEEERFRAWRQAELTAVQTKGRAETKRRKLADAAEPQQEVEA
jgi:predicted nucleic acid-binding Zn ribbon protein